MSDRVLAGGIAHLVRSVRSGAVAPVDLVDACLARIDKLNPTINAFISVAGEQAREQARRLQSALEHGEAVGALAGVPVALKDNFDVADMRTTAGSPLLAENVATCDSEVAARLRRAGAIIVGKLNMHEWAVGGTTQNPFFGSCRNPWEVARIPGGSSGGSGAAVAARMVPAAMGSDTGGSVRIPAALNGVSGLRPTFGRVSRRGLVPMSWTFDVAGPLAASVEDIAWLLRELADFDGADSGSVRRPTTDYVAALNKGPSGKGVRIGVLAGKFRALSHGDIWAAIERACLVFADLGANLATVEITDVDDLGDSMRVMMMAEAAAFHRQRLKEHVDGFGSDVLARLQAGTTITGAQYADAREAQRAWKRRFEGLFTQHDILLAPTCPIVAPLIAECDGVETTRLVGAFTYGFSLLGVPVLSVPCGLSAEELPIGMQLIAPWWQELALLGAGHAFQRVTDWHTATPSACG